jgi:tetratricopeptide (TPR) repeat protein
VKKSAVSLFVLATMIFVGCSSTTKDSTTGSQSTKSARSRSSKQKQEADPLYSLTLMRQGSILLQQEQFEEALMKFEEADRAAPGNATVHNMIGLCHLRMEQFDQALIAFNEALDLLPSYTDARNNRGATYLAVRQYRLAEVDFLAVLGDSTYPHHFQVYYNLGMTYLQQGQIGAAEDNLRRAVTAPSPVFEAFLRLSEVHHMQNQDDQAVALLEEARLSFPERIEASMKLGELLVELGRPNEARPYLEEVIAKEPGSARAQRAEALLGQ